jgi:hypothetical protein
MGGFAGALGQIGTGIAQNAANRSPVFRALYQRYLSGRNPTGTPQMANKPGYGQVANTAGWTINGQPLGDNAPAQGPGAMGQIPGPTGPPGADPMATDVGSDMGSGIPQLAGGTLITKPTIAKIGEAGPEAVVPLTPRPGNKMQPDIIEGRVAAPRVPGVHYSRYKSFNRFGPNAGGNIT